MFVDKINELRRHIKDCEADKNFPSYIVTNEQKFDYLKFLQKNLNKLHEQQIIYSIDRGIDVNVYAICPIVPEDFKEFIENFQREEDSLVIEENNIPIYEWPLNGGEKVQEEILIHFEKHLLPNGFSCDAHVDSVEVKIPVSSYRTYFGKVDAIVYNEKKNENIQSAYISIEIDRSLQDSSNAVLSLFKFIGMNIRSYLPVLHIRTDMETFEFMIYLKDEEKTFVYRTKDYSECKAIISNWIKYADSKKRYLKKETQPYDDNRIKALYQKIKLDQILGRLTIQFMPLFMGTPEKSLTNSKKNIIEYSREFLNDLERSYLNREESGELKEIAKCRSGTVYKLEDDGKSFAIKLCDFYAVDRKANRIIHEFIHETNAYQKLKDIEGPWPNLYYAGYIFDQNFYAIVTEFIDGRHPKKGDLTDFELCKGALEKLHDVGIVHGDPRPANFLISNNGHAIILDFGFSRLIKDSTYFEKDFSFMKRSFFI